jgi:hypothetical protein
VSWPGSGPLLRRCPGRHRPHQHGPAEPSSPGRVGLADLCACLAMRVVRPAGSCLLLHRLRIALFEYELSRRRRPGRAAAKVKACDEPSAAVPPGRPPIALPARPLGNPAADPVVTHPSSVALQLGCCLPGQADRHVPRRHQPAVPTHPCPEDARPSCSDRCSPAAWAAASQCGRDACHPLPAATGAILPNAVEEPGPA